MQKSFKIRFVSFEDEIEILDKNGNEIDIRGINRTIVKPKKGRVNNANTSAEKRRQTA